ncbi:MAG: T9SS type A sorting domain-containing protein [Bacteroidota bacterium]
MAVTPQAGPNALQIVSVNPNGQLDENQANDSLSADWLYPTAEAGVYYMVVKPDAYGSETSWKIFNAADSAIAEGGPYTDGNLDLVYLEVDLSEGEGCHRLEVYDTQGNGMSAVSQGYFRLLDPLGMPVTQNLDGDFGSQATYRFTLPEIEDPTAREDLMADQLQVFPNPTSGLVQVQFPAFQGQWVELQVMDLSGRVLSQVNTQDGQYQLTLSAYPTGMYLVKLSTDQGYQTVKLSKH